MSHFLRTRICGFEARRDAVPRFAASGWKRREGRREGGSTYITFSHGGVEIADGEDSEGDVDGGKDVG